MNKKQSKADILRALREQNAEKQGKKKVVKKKGR